MTHRTLYAALVVGLALSACAGSEPGGRAPVSPAHTVAMSLPDRPGEMCAGTGLIEVSTIPYIGPGESSAHLSLVGACAATGETFSMQLYVPLDAFSEALLGRAGAVPAFDPAVGTHYGTYTGATTDGRDPSEEVQSFTLALDGATITLTARVPSGTITAYGQFTFQCTIRNSNGDDLTDGRWESEFCSRTRDTLGLGPWIAASL